MSSFEEDAFARAQQMHRRRAQNQTQPTASPPKPQEPPPKISEERSEPTPQLQKPHTAPAQSNGFMDALFKDKDQSIILLLIVLLMEENSNPTLLLALIYLLI